MPTPTNPNPEHRPDYGRVFSFRLKRPAADRLERAADRAGVPLSTYLRRTFADLTQTPGDGSHAPPEHPSRLAA